jgi:hypothetical protein
MGCLLTHIAGDVDELQSSLQAQRCKRLCDRLCGNVGGERLGLERLSQHRRVCKDSNGRADRQTAQYRRHHGRDTR